MLAKCKLQHLANVCKVLKSLLCHPSFMPQALFFSELDHTYIWTLCVQGLLCVCVNLQKEFGSFNHRVAIASLVAVKLKEQWL